MTVIFYCPQNNCRNHLWSAGFRSFWNAICLLLSQLCSNVHHIRW